MLDDRFSVASGYYYSNCLIEALKAKIHNPKVKIYFCKPRIVNGNFQTFHFMWSDSDADYDFSDMHRGEMKWYKYFIFRGSIRKFNKGFAKKYSRYRNKKTKRELGQSDRMV